MATGWVCGHRDMVTLFNNDHRNELRWGWGGGGKRTGSRYLPWPWEQIQEFLNFPCMPGFPPRQVKLPGGVFPRANLGNRAISMELPRETTGCIAALVTAPVSLRPVLVLKHVIRTRLVKTHSPFETALEHRAMSASALFLSAHSRAGEGCPGKRGQGELEFFTAGWIHLGFPRRNHWAGDSFSTPWGDIRRQYISCLCLHGGIENPACI